MTERPNLSELEACDDEACAYDFAHAQRILMAMDLLRGEAVKADIGEIVAMVDANFRLLLTSYRCILRYEATRLTGNAMVQ